jgi:3-oxoadipate enol-lactonase
MPTKYVTVHDTPIHYWHTGRTTLPDVLPDLSRGEVVLFVHGAGWHGALWEAPLQALETEHSPLAFDFPGHGRSGGTEALGSIEEYADCLVGLISALRLRPCVLVGHDLGAAIALACAIRQPSLVRALVLTGAAACFDIPQPLLDIWRDVMRGRRPQPFTNDGFSPQTDVAVLRRVLSEQIKTDPRVRYHDLAVLRSFEVTPWLAEIDIPALIVAGRDDPYASPARAEALHAGLRGSRLQVVDGAGHYVPWEQSAVFESALSGFLRALGGDR